MSDEEKVEYTCIVNRTPRTVTIRHGQGGVVPGPNCYAEQVWVSIGNQRVNYLIPETLRLDLALSIANEKVRKWQSKENWDRLLARDAVNVLLKNKASAFTSTGKRNTYLVSLNELANALEQERNVLSASDEAEIIDLYLVGFEENISMNVSTLYISTDYSADSLSKKMILFDKRDFVKTVDAGQYTIKDWSKYDVLEERIERLLSRHTDSSASQASKPAYRHLQPVKPQTTIPFAFVGLPFKLSDHFAVIEEVCKSNGLLAYRIDHDPSFDTFLNKVIGAILQSNVCVFDVTDFNPNVMLELGVAMSTNKQLIVIADEKSYVEAQEQWKSDVQKSISPEHFVKLEEYLKDSKFINLVPSDVRERSVHLFRSMDDLKSKLNAAFQAITE